MMRISRRITIFALILLSALATSACGRGMLDTHSPEAKRIALLWWLMFALAGAVFIAVSALLLYALMHHRTRPSAFERRPALQMLFVTVGGAAIPLLILIVVFGFTVGVMAASRTGTSGVPIQVTGHNYWWEVRYPGADVIVDNEIHVPVGREIDFELISNDVIHSFWVPQLNGKVDMVPGLTNHMSITVSSPGTYRGKCAEFCGMGHACMTFVVFAQPQDEFDAWLAAQDRRPSGDPQEFKNGECVGRSAGVVGRDQQVSTPATG